MSSRTVLLTMLVISFALFGAGCNGQKVQEGAGSTVEPTAAEEPGWRVLGPGGGGAQFLATINPDDPDHVFVRCDMTGAYVTHDGGESWRMFNLRTVVRDYEFDPVESNTVYASNSGLWRSDDRGGRWELVYPDPADIGKEMMYGDHADHSFRLKDGSGFPSIDLVRVDPSDNSRIFIGQPAPMVYSAGSAPRRSGRRVTISMSDDRGETWRELAELDGSDVLGIFPGSWHGEPGEVTVVTDVTIAGIELAGGTISEHELPVERMIHAGGGSGAGEAILYVLAPMKDQNGEVTGGIYRTADLGASWQRASSGLAADYASSGRLPFFRTFSVSEGNPEVLYLGCNDYWVATDQGTDRHYGVLKSSDSGENWDWVYRARSDVVLTNNHEGGWLKKYYGPEWGEYPMSIGVSPTDPDICFVNDLGCTYRTLNGGETWKQVYTRQVGEDSWVSRGLDVTTCYGVHFDPFDPRHIFISYTDIGAFHSFDGGESWMHTITGIPRAWRNTCYWMTFDPDVERKAWSVWGSGHDLPRPKMFRSGNFERYVGGAAVSDDGARTWQQSNNGMPSNTVCTHIVLDPDSDPQSRTLYVCGFGKGVFKSTDGGASWTNSSNGIGPNMNAWRITMLPDGMLYLLVARGLENRETVDGALYVSDDSAETWRNLTLPEYVNGPNDLVYDPDDPSRMYLSCWPEPHDGVERGGGLFRTEDGGRTWEQVFQDDTHVYAAAVNPDNPADIYINTFESAAFRSLDYGENWERLEGYNFKWGHRPVLDPHNSSMLYLTTFGGSVFHGPREGVPGAFEDIIDLSFSKWYGKY